MKKNKIVTKINQEETFFSFDIMIKYKIKNIRGRAKVYIETEFKVCLIAMGVKEYKIEANKEVYLLFEILKEIKKAIMTDKENNKAGMIL